MTLEQAGISALRAASHGDLEDLQIALDARDAAIAELANERATAEVHARLSTAAEIGNAIRDAIRAFKQRTAAEGSRLSQVQAYSR